MDKLKKAVLNEAEKRDISIIEKRYENFLVDNEIRKFYVAKMIEPLISVTEEEIIEEYNSKKALYDKSKTQFEDVKDAIEGMILQQKIYFHEQQEIQKLVHNMEQKIYLSKEDIMMAGNNPEIFKLLLLNEIVKVEIKKTFFHVKYREKIEEIRDNIIYNIYIDKLSRERVVLDDVEVEEELGKNKEKYENFSQTVAKERAREFVYFVKMFTEKDKIKKEIIEKYNLN